MKSKKNYKNYFFSALIIMSFSLRPSLSSAFDQTSEIHKIVEEINDISGNKADSGHPVTFVREKDNDGSVSEVQPDKKKDKLSDSAVALHKGKGCSSFSIKELAGFVGEKALTKNEIAEFDDEISGRTKKNASVNTSQDMRKIELPVSAIASLDIKETGKDVDADLTEELKYVMAMNETKVDPRKLSTGFAGVNTVDIGTKIEVKSAAAFEMFSEVTRNTKSSILEKNMADVVGRNEMISNIAPASGNDKGVQDPGMAPLKEKMR